MSRGSGTVQRLDAEQRAVKAWQGRVAGLTWAQVAAHAGFSDATAACRAVSRYFGQLPAFDREQQRELWRARLEKVWIQTVLDMKEGKAGATRSAVAVAQRAAQLDGLDEPTRMELRTPEAAEMEALVRAMLAASGGPREIEGDPFSDPDEDIEDADVVD